MLVSFRSAVSPVCHHRLIQKTENIVSNENTLLNILFLLLYSKCLLKIRNWPKFPFSGQHIFTVFSSSQVFSKEQYCTGHLENTKKKSLVLKGSVRYQTQRRRNVSSSVDQMHRLKCLEHQGPEVKYFITRLSRLINSFPACIWFGCLDVKTDIFLKGLNCQRSAALQHSGEKRNQCFQCQQHLTS